MPGGTPSPIECHVFKKAHGFVILGERLILTGDEALRRISLVNNEMANLLRDVQRKNRALDESEERYRTAIEHSNDGVALVRGDRHVYVNRRFLDMFGYDTPEGIIGEVTYVTVHPDDRERVMEYNRLRQQGLPAPSQYEFRGDQEGRHLIFRRRVGSGNGLPGGGVLPGLSQRYNRPETRGRDDQETPR